LVEILFLYREEYFHKAKIDALCESGQWRFFSAQSLGFACFFLFF